VFAPIASRLSRRSLDERPDRDRPEPAQIDRFLADYDAVSRRHRVVDATAEETYDAMLRLDLTDVGPVVDTLGALRALPERVGVWLDGRETDGKAASIRFGDLPTRGDWIRLADVPGEEFVFGAVGTVWRPSIEWVELSADAFGPFDRPGYAKIVAGFSFRPYGRSRTLVTYEARTAGTDATATRWFGRYWRVVGPFVGVLLGRVLRRIAAEAEAETETETEPGEWRRRRATTAARRADRRTVADRLLRRRG
jgi:hypothetical protein